MIKVEVHCKLSQYDMYEDVIEEDTDEAKMLLEK